MDTMELLIDLHKRNARQGPGSQAATERAIELAGLGADPALRIADIGCGTGASTLTLARRLGGRITAVDFLQEFLDVLVEQAAAAGLDDRIETHCGPMESLPFADAELDVIWAEGAIYNIGFETGIRDWRRFLKPGGVLVASEITWLTAERPDEITAHWQAEYPQIDTASAKMAQLEQHGYRPTGYFVLPETCWLDDYYRPLQAGFADFMARHPDDAEAKVIVEAEEEEIALYEQCRAYYSYGVYIAQRL
jgi:ubiquinone/menaquinone biosynthesis C-methylase UbiE